MLTPICPKCSGIISSDDINVGANLAYCRECNLAHILSALAQGSGIDPNIDLDHPPSGAWYRINAAGTRIGASHRSIPTAIFTFAFGAFWNGIVSIFVMVALAGTLANLGFKQPDWFPAPVMNKSPMGIGMTIFLWLFLTPFILVGLAMIGAFLSSLAGQTEVLLRDLRGEIFVGVGPLGYKRRFTTETVKDVRIEDRRWVDSDGDRRRNTHIIIELTEGTPLKLGSSLCDERRQFVAAALRKALLP